MALRMDPAPFRRVDSGDSGTITYKQGFGIANLLGLGGMSLVLYLWAGFGENFAKGFDFYGVVFFLILSIPMLGLALAGFMVAFEKSYLSIEKRSQTIVFRQPTSFPINKKTLPLSDYSECIVVANRRESDGESYLVYSLIIVGKECENLDVWDSFSEPKLQAIADEINAFVGWPIEKKTTSFPDSTSGTLRA